MQIVIWQEKLRSSMIFQKYRFYDFFLKKLSNIMLLYSRNLKWAFFLTAELFFQKPIDFTDWDKIINRWKLTFFHMITN